MSGTAERVEVGNYDGLAGLEAGDDFDGAQTAGAGSDLAALGDAFLGYDVGQTATAAIEELAALHHEDVGVLGEQDARRQALVLPQVPSGPRRRNRTRLATWLLTTSGETATSWPS